jgi:hypothetical protein
MRRFASLVAALAAVAVAVPAYGAPIIPKLAGCVPGSTPSVRPRQIIVACGDANFYFTNLAWSAWNAKQAVAGGVAHLNDCKPYCAAGHFHTYKVAITLTQPKTCANGNHEFTRMSWRYLLGVPAGQPRSGGRAPPCR